jgi:hypothetical protein
MEAPIFEDNQLFIRVIETNKHRFYIRNGVAKPPVFWPEHFEEKSLLLVYKQRGDFPPIDSGTTALALSSAFNANGRAIHSILWLNYGKIAQLGLTIISCSHLVGAPVCKELYAIDFTYSPDGKLRSQKEIRQLYTGLFKHAKKLGSRW